MIIYPLVIEHIVTCGFTYRSMEDFVTWKDTSKIRKHVLEYNEEVIYNI